MGWDLSSHGLVINLDKRISTEIYSSIKGFTDELLQFVHTKKQWGAKANRGPINAKDAYFAVHPGDPLILQAIIDALGVKKSQCQVRIHVMHSYTHTHIYIYTYS
jgi:predicted naringenin-chalcone synthase